MMPLSPFTIILLVAAAVYAPYSLIVTGVAFGLAFVIEVMLAVGTE